MGTSLDNAKHVEVGSNNVRLEKKITRLGQKFFRPVENLLRCV